MSSTRPVNLARWAWAVGWALLASTGAWAAKPIGYARLQFLPARTPSVYLQVNDDNTIRVAPSARDLSKAKPLSPLKPLSDREVRRGAMYEYPEVALPVSANGIAGAKARLRLRRDTRGVTLLCHLRVTRRAPSGTPLTYAFTVGKSAASTNGPEAEGLLLIPDLSKTRLLVQAKVDEESGLLTRFFPPKDQKVGLSARLLVDSLEITDVQVGGKSVPVHLEVKDAKGKVVHEKTGTFETFGFT